MTKHHMIQLILGRQISTVGGRLFTNITAKRLKSDDRGSGNVGPKKPDLRQAGQDKKAVKIVGAVCVLVAIYMYPMIFKPLFGIGSSEDTEHISKTLEELQIKLEKHRPSNMPEWTSPFGPKKGEE